LINRAISLAVFGSSVIKINAECRTLVHPVIFNRFAPTGFLGAEHLIARLRSVTVLTGRFRNAALRYRSALVSEFAMNDVVDRILNTYQLMRPLDADQVSDSRRKVTRYIESLASAGQSDAQQLAVYGLAYLKELHDGRDPRFTGR
jgi:hypothetical protein